MTAIDFAARNSANDFYHSSQDRPSEPPSTINTSDEPKNVQDDSAPADDVQRGETEGRDPNTEGEDTLAGDHPKMTGTGAPGSHSAVFGLTPDGKTDTNTKSSTTKVKPAHSEETSNTSTADTGSRADGGGDGIKEQVSVLNRWHREDADTPR